MYLTSFLLYSKGQICEGSDMRGSDMRGSDMRGSTVFETLVLPFEHDIHYHTCVVVCCT